MPNTATKSAIKTDLTLLLSELIQFRTITHDSHANRQALDWFGWQTSDLPLYISHFEKNGDPTLWATTRRTKHPKVLLLAHMDVVPASDNSFKPRVKDGRLYGRGAFDMKFAIACYLKLLHEIGDHLRDYDLGVALVSDEEDGGFNGAKSLVEKGYGGSIVVIPDGASDWGIEERSKSLHKFLIESYGSSAHASRPWEGVNAITQLTDFLREVQNRYPKEPCGDPKHHHDTCVVGTIKGGEVYNQIPHYARAEVNIRTLEDTGRDLEKMLDEIRSGHKNIIISHPTEVESFAYKTNHPAYSAWAGLVKDIVGAESEFVLSHGQTDARYFAHKNAVLISKPTGGPQHSENEWIDIKSMNQYYEVLRAFVEKFARIR